MNEQKANKRNFKAELTEIMKNRGHALEMGSLNEALRKRVLEIYAGNSEGTIATLRPDGWPQANVVDFWHVGLTLYFGTFESTQKVVNIERDPRVSLTITPPFDDFGEMTGISMAARAEKVTDRSKIGDMYRLFLERVPHMKEFARHEGDKVYPAPGIVVYCVRPEIISILDYTRGYGQVDLIKINEDDIGE